MNHLVSAIPVLPVTNVEQAVAFYESKLGFTRNFVFADAANVGRDGVHLHFWLTDDAGLPGRSSCRIVTRGIEAVYAELQRQKVIHPQGQLATKPWGLREFTALDCFGNALVFVETRL